MERRTTTFLISLCLELLAVAPSLAEGAFAFSQELATGGWASGTAFDYATAALAQENAMAHCSGRGTHCQVLAQFHNLCFAIAIQDNGNAFGWQTAADQADANNAALLACARYRENCTVRAAFCDHVEEVVQMLACTQPIFVEEERLKNTIDGFPETTDKAIAAINYLRSRYCGLIHDIPAQEEEISLSDNCYQLSGQYRGEKVYWYQCFE